jgi:hypothetical protein
MPQAETRRLAAIMFTDIVGFSHQMGANEARMLRLLAAHNHILHQAVTEHQGHVIKTMGDAFVVDFPSVVNAVQCAQHVQEQFRTHNSDKEKTEQIHIRIGKEEEVQNCLRQPELVRHSTQDQAVYLFYLSQPPYYLVVVAKRLDGEGFIITSYLGDKIKEGETVWPTSV